jgi:hypothetical protein
VRACKENVRIKGEKDATGKAYYDQENKKENVAGGLNE